MSFDLEFEKPLADIERRVQNLRGRHADSAQIAAAEQELQQRTREIYSKLTPWHRVQLARHKDRPYTADYIRFLITDFFELRGDRRFADDRAIQGGMGLFEGETVMVLGHQKGRDTHERQETNFGMPHPEGYRKAARLMLHAERFGIPIITFIDTAGAWLGLDAEERGISQAIAENLYIMANLKTPIIAIVIGEGGSGGALGISIADRILMLENSIYTVAAPEAAASILWKDSKQAPQAAEAMKITAADLKEFGLIDQVIPEPLGGAHRNHKQTAENVRTAIREQLAILKGKPADRLVSERYERWRRIGEPERVRV